MNLVLADIWQWLEEEDKGPFSWLPHRKPNENNLLFLKSFLC
jgi:hypothetical protein